MTDSFLEKLKKSVLAGAQTSATKIEEAARQGKLHLDILAEKRKLARDYGALGKEAHLALLEGAESALPGRAGVADLQASIDRRKRAIADLELKLAQMNPKAAKPR